MKQQKNFRRYFKCGEGEIETDRQTDRQTDRHMTIKYFRHVKRDRER